VQSHYFSVGSVVPWAEAGVGVVATQSFLNLAYGPEGLELMRSGRSAPEALAELLERDPEQDLRQVAMVDAFGCSAAHTGERCIAAAGHLIGDGYSVQANIMVDTGVWPAMAHAYEAASGDLADRLVTTLEAAQAAGGDLRGQQSAALLVVAGEPPQRPGEGKRFDLRVEDHPTPLVELRRLLQLARAYRFVEEADAAVGQGRFEDAAAAYQMAIERAPDIAELQVWAAIALLQMGREGEAMTLFGVAFLADPRLVELLPRVAALGLVEADPVVLERIVALSPRRGTRS
jgi:uncharacterized Ntn-hydrolase superfamily protein